MILNIHPPRKALNQAFRKVKANRNEIELFKKTLIHLLDSIKEPESEEFHKNLVSDFLKTTYYGTTYYINTKGRNDLVIHNSSTSTDTVGVIVEAKKPTNKTEMLKTDNINTKAFQELVLYYLRERITLKNLEVKHLIATNIHEWFIFDANVFEKEFAENKNLVKQFIEFEEGRLSGKTTDFFYKQIAEPAIEAIKHEITFAYFDIRDYNKPLRNDDKKDDNLLISLYKLLSPAHLLKLPFTNDSNSLDKVFYTELLHIIGLTETKEGGKKLIQRKKEGDRNIGSLLENTIVQLDSHDKISRIKKPSQFGATYQEQLFNVALELVITWMNRILFLKLLEAQLLSYHKGNRDYAFLDATKIRDFDDLDKLFFRVLAKRPVDRDESINKLFGLVPYLNSSLFEPTELEHNALFISGLEDFVQLPYISSTVIKDSVGKRGTQPLSTLEYLFSFLNAYDFASEGGEEIQEDNKQLINASVLGLIFEKINGYKDGSFFTPGFITMYMCRETIRRSVVQKFNETKDWNCANFTELYDKIEDRAEANNIINNLKICDPAVGSGHFLVSALNEIIAIKSDLKILTDRSGRRFKEYHLEIQNDELIVIDDEGDIFEYNPRNPESQRIQETLFHEKQTIIENSLFGVDINPNSVKICRLRLWIELLKNAYYKAPDFAELETLPNIDINIKCGNSLISRYSLDADIKTALKRSKWSIDSYRLAVMNYRNASSKDEKRELERLIVLIKTDFETEIAITDKRFVKLQKAKGELMAKTTQTSLFERSKAEQVTWNKEVKTLAEIIEKLDSEIEEIKNNKIYENAFEWRFEFPEVLNDEGDFVGFDIVIGNPPYVLVQSLGDKNIFDHYSQNYTTATYKIDTYALFYEMGINLLSNNAIICLITPNTFLKNKYSKELRNLILSNSLIQIINFYTQVFEDASVDTLILMLSKNNQENPNNKFWYSAYKNNVFNLYEIEKYFHLQNEFKKGNLELELDINTDLRSLLAKIEIDTKPLSYYGRSYFGIQTFDRKQFVSKTKIDENYFPVIDGGNIKRYKLNPHSEFVDFKKESIKSGGDPNVYKKDRIVIRQIGIYPEGTIIPPNLMTLNTIYNIYLHKDDILFLKYLLSLINSKLFQFYWYKKFYDNKATFPKIKKEPIESYPIKEPKKEIVDIISKLVDEIITIKAQLEIVDTTALEAEIDHLVYELYGLTEEEIEIVEKA